MAEPVGEFEYRIYTNDPDVVFLELQYDGLAIITTEEDATTYKIIHKGSRQPPIEASKYHRCKVIAPRRDLVTVLFDQDRMQQIYRFHGQAFYKMEFIDPLLAHTVDKFDLLLHDLVSTLEEPPQAMGRPKLRARDVVFCMLHMIHTRSSSRAAIDYFNYLYNCGLIRHIPHFNAMTRILDDPEITPMLESLERKTFRMLENLPKDRLTQLPDVPENSWKNTSNINEHIAKRIVRNLEVLSETSMHMVMAW